MTVITINQRAWTLGETLGSGGFGRVYAASSGGEEAVIKLVPKDPGAQRELLLADDLSGVPNVVPVIDSGESGDNWAILMPRAEQSLRDYLLAIGRPLKETEVLCILLDITKALVSLTVKDVVHRDLKPENVLLLDGRWCLTDFGVSRYAQATTAADTRKYSMTRPYAAPEQWREQRATAATDIYALGVIAFELAMGRRPFVGPHFREQHLHEDPPPLAGFSPRLAALIEECLIKAPEARPTPSNLLVRLEKHSSGMSTTAGLAALISANRAEVARRSIEARKLSENLSESERRAALLAAARRSRGLIDYHLVETILSLAPTASVPVNPPIYNWAWRLQLSGGRLGMSNLQSTSSPGLPFDVIAYCHIAVSMPSRIRYESPYAGRGHSLWYCDAQESDRYSWFETAFMHHPLSAGGIQTKHTYFGVEGLYSPFAEDPGVASAKSALGPGMGTDQVAWPFTPLTIGDLDDFIDRWANWFAAASTGRLQPPQTMPERPVDGSWRRA